MIFEEEFLTALVPLLIYWDTLVAVFVFFTAPTAFPTSFVAALPAADATQPSTNELPIVFRDTSCPVNSRTPVSTTALTTPPITTFPTHANSEPKKCPVGSM